MSCRSNDIIIIIRQIRNTITITMIGNKFRSLCGFIIIIVIIVRL